MTQHLFRGGQTFAEVGRAMAQVRSARAQLVDTERRVLFGAVAAYLDVVRDEKVVALNRQNVDALQKELDAAKTQRGAGAVTRTDVDQAEARLSRAQSDVAAAERQLATSRSTSSTSLVSRRRHSIRRRSCRNCRRARRWRRRSARVTARA